MLVDSTVVLEVARLIEHLMLYIPVSDKIKVMWKTNLCFEIAVLSSQ